MTASERAARAWQAAPLPVREGALDLFRTQNTAALRLLVEQVRLALVLSEARDDETANASHTNRSTP